MQNRKQPQPKYSWEETIEILRNDAKHQSLIFDAYLTSDLMGNCQRFAASAEFCEAENILKRYAPNGRYLLDLPGGNGIASFAFARAGFEVTAVEPDPSASVGRAAATSVLAEAGLRATFVDAYGESLPLADESFDIVYVRQGLHHAKNLPVMLIEISRVLRPGGILLACREHVVDNYGASLEAFLRSQIDHQLYGGENAFTLRDYRRAILSSGLSILLQLGPYDSIINAYPNTPEVLRQRVLKSRPGRILRRLLPDNIVATMGAWLAKHRRLPGRLYSFVARKPATNR